MALRDFLLTLTLVLFLGGAFFFTRRMLAIIGVMRKALPTQRLDQTGRRLASLVVQVLGHRRLLRIRLSGILHYMIFSGFVVLFIDIVETLIEPYGISIPPVLATIVDIWVLMVLGGVALALFNRLVLRPERFRGSDERDAYLILGLISAIAVGIVVHDSFFPFVAAGVLHVADGAASGHFLGNWVSGLWRALGWTTPTAASIGYTVGYLMDIGVVFFFLGYLPNSKHFHVFLAVPAIFLRSLRPAGELSGEATAEQFAIRDFQGMRWKDLLDLFTCTECGRCQAVCPAYASGTPLSPKHLILELRDALNRTIRGEAPEPLAGGVVSAEELWSCTTCGACMEACPVFIEHVPKIAGLRAALLEDGELPQNAQKALMSFERQQNSFGQPARKRPDWTKPLDFPVKDARKEPVDWLWFVGDFASYDPRAQEASRLMAQILHRAGVDFGMLYESEANSGNDALRMGEFGLFEALADKNMKSLREVQCNRVITTDPHSFNALRNEYRRYGFETPVQHYTQALLELIGQGRLEVKPLGIEATYHDPCFLGRWNQIFDAPRDLLGRCGVTLREMPRNRSQSFCCGAGGGRLWLDEGGAGERPADQRIREALTVDTPYFVVACPKDIAMFSAAVVSTGSEERIKVIDVAEIVYAACGLGAPLLAVASD